jgi:hypothetical protein
MLAAWAKASALPTEVPPNFMTIILCSSSFASCPSFGPQFVGRYFGA